MSLVGVDNPLHNVLVVGSCGTLLVLYLIQILLCLVLHINLRVVHCTKVHGYTARGYIVDAHYYNVAAHCCIDVAHCCIDVAHFCMVVLLG
jgi:hypothetical protein